MLEPERHLKVFLCHASQDKPIVRELYQRLKAEDWIDTWLDEKKLLPGQDWQLNIQLAVETSDIVIICLSGNSVSKEGFIQKELRFAREVSLEKPEGSIFLIPLRIDDCDVPRSLRFYQWVDYFGEKKDETYNSLLESLKLRYRQKLKIEEEAHTRKEEERVERGAAEISTHSSSKLSFPEYTSFQQDLESLIAHAADNFVRIREETPTTNPDAILSYRSKFSFEYSTGDTVWYHNGKWYFTCYFCKDTTLQQAKIVFEQRRQEIKSKLASDWRFEEKENPNGLHRKEFEAIRKYNTLRIRMLVVAFSSGNRSQVDFTLEQL